MLMMMIPLMSDNKTLAVSMPYACSLVCPRLQSRMPTLAVSCACETCFVG